MNPLTHTIFLNGPNLFKYAEATLLALTISAAALQNLGVPVPQRQGADLHTTPTSGHYGHPHKSIIIFSIFSHPFFLWPNVLFDLL